MKTADKVSRELRRFGRQLVNVKNHGCFNPYTRMRRPNRPEAIQENPGWEIESPLEFIASHVAHRRGNFRFVQIGAFDGIQYDSLPQLAIKNQWRGILVEPQPAAFELLSQSCAQHDCFDLANVAIGEQQGELDFYTTVDAPSNLASIDRQHLLRFGLPEVRLRSYPFVAS